VLFALILLGVVLLYGLVAMPVILTRRAKIRRQINTGVYPAGDTELTNTAANGVELSQMGSFLLHLVLLGIGICWAIAALVTQNIAANGSMILALVALLFLTPITIIVNAFWVYPKVMMMAEQSAFIHKTASPLLRIETILAWVVWIGYSVFGCIVFVNTAIIVIAPYNQ